MATTVTTLSSNLKAMDQEVHIINWEAADATEEVTTGLSIIYAVSICDAFGTAAGHTDDDLGIAEIDEAYVLADGTITTVSNAITVNRIKASTGGTLAAAQTCLILWGKS